MENMDNEINKAVQANQPSGTDETISAYPPADFTKRIKPVMEEFAAQVASTLKESNRDVVEVKREITEKTTVKHNSYYPSVTILSCVMEGVFSVGVVYDGQLVKFSQRFLPSSTAGEASFPADSPSGAESSFSALSPKPHKANNMAIYLDIGQRQRQGW